MVQPDTVLQGRYLILKQIGQGGMGAVYRAKDQRLNTIVALKETLFQDEVLLKAFHREAHLLASLKHPALPKVSDHFTEGERQFLVMEFISGDDLETLLQRRNAPFPVADVLDWADQLLDALDYLHTQEKPIIHRDIKPQNLKLSERGRIFLLDFGLAKGSLGETLRPLTNVSLRGYTPTYAPLEQIHSSGTNARSDLYALAATLYHLITSVTPPDALTRAGAVLNSKPDPLLPADRVNPQVPPSVAAVLAQAMSLKRDQRPASAAAMRQALSTAMEFCEATTGSLKAVSQSKTTAGPATPPDAQKQTAAPSSDTLREYTQPLSSPRPPEPQPAPPVGKSKRMVYLAGVLAVLLIVGITYALRNGNPYAANAVTGQPEVVAPADNADAKPGTKQEGKPATNDNAPAEKKTPAVSRNESKQQAASVNQTTRKPREAVRKRREKPKPALPTPPRSRRSAY